MAGGIALAVTVAVTGCGAAKELSAKDSVTAAVEAVAAARTATFTISLDSTVADLQKLDAAGSGGDRTAAKNLQQVLDGDLSVSVTVPEGSSLSELSKEQQGSGDVSTLLQDPAALKEYMSAQGSIALAVRLGGSALFELRSVGTTVYARADVPKLLTISGEDPAMVSSFTGQMPPALQPVARAAKGEWLAVDLVEAVRSLKSSGLLNQLPKQGVPTAANPAAVTKLLQDLKTAYEQKARITTIGEDGERGTGYRLTAPAKQVAQALQSDLVALTGKDSAEDVRNAVAEVPEKDVSVEVWVKDDELRAVSLDLAQFSEQALDARAALKINIALDGDPVAAPAGANKLDVAEALVGVGGLMGGMAGAGAGAMPVQP
jgi:hypothetical protein